MVRSETLLNSIYINLVWGSDERSIVVWDLASGNKEARLAHDVALRCCQISPKGLVVTATEHQIQVACDHVFPCPWLSHPSSDRPGVWLRSELQPRLPATLESKACRSHQPHEQLRQVFAETVV
jgi:hypothetical protein